MTALELLRAVVAYTEREPQVLDCSDCNEHMDDLIEQIKAFLEQNDYK